MRRVSIVVALLSLYSSACDRPTPTASASPEESPQPASLKTAVLPTVSEQGFMNDLARNGAQALPGLIAQTEVAYGTTWLKGNVVASGSTAYLYLGKLGETSSTLRLVVRYEGSHAVQLGNCTVIVDGVEVGSFSPAPNQFENLPGGKVSQLADIHFDDVLQIVLAMLKGKSSVIRAADGSEILLGRSELDEMRRVLSAYLHLQGHH